MGSVLAKIMDKFFSKKLELCLLGLENSGKTTFVDQLQGKTKNTIPTIDVNMKIWDIGGQYQFRQNWVDYAKLADVIIFMIDSSDYEKISVSKKELQSLLDNKELENKPLLVLSNKIDIEPHMSEAEIIRELNLDYIYSNPWAVINMSALRGTNLEQVLDWLSKKGK